MLALGVDRWDGRWVGIALENGVFSIAAVADDIATLVRSFDEPAVVGVDIPIGLPETGRRESDRLAKTEIGRLQNSVFWTPVREALAAETHAEATLISSQLTGHGISRQSYGLRAAIFDVARWIATGNRAYEVHPEVSFAAMNSGPLTARKKSWAGAMQRRTLLERRGVVLPDDLGAAGVAGPDDVLDAAACAWTATRIASNEARSLPDPPDSEMTIWI